MYQGSEPPVISKPSVPAAYIEGTAYHCIRITSPTINATAVSKEAQCAFQNSRAPLGRCSSRLDQPPYLSWLPIIEIATPIKNVIASQISGDQESLKLSFSQNPDSYQEPTRYSIQSEEIVIARVNQRSATIPETMIATIPVRSAGQ